MLPVTQNIVEPKHYRLFAFKITEYDEGVFDSQNYHQSPIFVAAGISQLVIALPSVMEVPSLILSDSNVCFDFLLVYVAFALTEGGGKGCTIGFPLIPVI